MTREQLNLIFRHSNIDAPSIKTLLVKHDRPSVSAWMKFIRISVLVMGVGFFTAGIIFFFAFNWDALHKFVKLAIIQFLMVGTAAIWFIKKWPLMVRKISITASAVLVGALFAVYGQIYQTEAMAFDLLRLWLLVVTPMAIAAGFAPLSMIWVILLNVTIGTYHEQVLRTGSETTLILILAYTNLFLLLVPQILKKTGNVIAVPKWFQLILVSAGLFMLTIGVVVGLDNPGEWTFLVSLATILFLYGFLTHQGRLHKSIIPLVLGALSVLVVISAVILKIDSDEYGTLFLSVFLIATSTLLTRYFLHLKKSWSHATK